jgi:NAD(P)-dependent dehydrogenase (short-subunit alcohol dehydrogenase family)
MTSKVAIISGVRRIGFYIAQHLLSSGFHLAVLYRSSSQTVEELKKYASRFNKKVLPFKVDLSNPQTYRDIPSKVFETFNRIDALLNIASPFERKSVLETTEGDLEFYFRAVVESSFILSKESFKYMLRKEGQVKGRIINFGDWAVHSNNPYPNFAPYLVAKGALRTLTQVLAVEFAPHVLVNEIALGPVLPPEYTSAEGKIKKPSTDWEEYVKRKTLLGRPVDLEDILSAVDFLLKAKTVSGEVLVLDSGQRFVGKGFMRLKPLRGNFK